MSSLNTLSSNIHLNHFSLQFSSLHILFDGTSQLSFLQTLFSMFEGDGSISMFKNHTLSVKERKKEKRKKGNIIERGDTMMEDPKCKHIIRGRAESIVRMWFNSFFWVQQHQHRLTLFCYSSDWAVCMCNVLMCKSHVL